MKRRLLCLLALLCLFAAPARAEEACAHEFTREAVYSAETIYEDNGSTHSAVAVRHYSVICADCEAVLENGCESREILSTSAHVYLDGGTCTVCGHICTHEAIEEEWSYLREICRSIGPERHQIFSLWHETQRCAECGMQLSAAESEELTGEAAHRFRDGVCLDCGERCAHETVTEVSAGSSTRYEDGGEHHIRIDTTRTDIVCAQCGLILRTEEREERQEGAHDFSGGTCVCGALCPHGDTEVFRAMSEVVWQDNGDGTHTGSWTVTRRETCRVCGQTVSEGVTEEQLTEGHTGSLCEKCGAVTPTEAPTPEPTPAVTPEPTAVPTEAPMEEYEESEEAEEPTDVPDVTPAPTPALTPAPTPAPTDSPTAGVSTPAWEKDNSNLLVIGGGRYARLSPLDSAVRLHGVCAGDAMPATAVLAALGSALESQGAEVTILRLDGLLDTATGEAFRELPLQEQLLVLYSLVGKRPQLRAEAEAVAEAALPQLIPSAQRLLLADGAGFTLDLMVKSGGSAEAERYIFLREGSGYVLAEVHSGPVQKTN